MSPQAAPATPQEPAPPVAERVLNARMLTYRLIPVWVFLLMLGSLMIWEFGIKGSPATSEKLQAVTLLSLLVALFIGATVGIRFFNPQPPKP